MTIRQAIEQGIQEVTTASWAAHNQYCRMVLPVKDERGHHGVWGRIIDPAGNLATGKPAEYEIPIMLLNLPPGQLSADPDEDEWQPWKRPENYDDWLRNCIAEH